jgi:diguanylate cyclase
MVLLTLFIAVINFGLGFGLAILFAEQSSVPGADTRPSVWRRTAPKRKGILKATLEKAKEIPVEELPSEWVEKLAENSVEAKSMVEASVEVLRLEVGKYRESLLQIEDEVREQIHNDDPAAMNAFRERLRAVNADWLAKQSDAAEHLSARKTNLGDFAEVGNNLEDVLLDQAAQIETTVSNIDLLDFESDLRAGCRRLLVEICRLVDLSHGLRDQMQESLTTILRADKRLGDVERNLQFDAKSNLYSRTGLDVIMWNWWKEDIPRKRLISAAIVDVDKMGRCNQRWSTRIGDLILSNIGSLISELFTSGRGQEKVARLGGQSFVVIFGDTGPRNALGVVERVRQTLEKTTFEVDHLEMEFTVSAGVIEIRKDDRMADVLKRLQKTLRVAKKLGRNKTAIDDDGTGAHAVEPPEFHVSGRVIQVGTSEDG